MYLLNLVHEYASILLFIHYCKQVKWTYFTPPLHKQLLIRGSSILFVVSQQKRQKLFSWVELTWTCGSNRSSYEGSSFLLASNKLWPEGFDIAGSFLQWSIGAISSSLNWLWMSFTYSWVPLSFDAHLLFKEWRLFVLPPILSSEPSWLLIICKFSGHFIYSYDTLDYFYIVSWRGRQPSSG